MSKKSNSTDEGTPGELPQDVSAVPELMPDEFKKRQDAVIQQKQFVTSKVSETSRFIGFGLLAVFYTASISTDQFAVEVLNSNPWLAHLFGACGALTILFDYIQYVAGERAAERALRRSDDGQNTFLYNKRWWQYRLREFSYRAKQVLALAGSCVLAYVMISALLRTSELG